jgi:hypothetical protein
MGIFNSDRFEGFELALVLFVLLVIVACSCND